MNDYNFDAEMDLLAQKIPDLYEEESTRHIRIPYRVTWIGIRMRACEKVFGTTTIPKIATEEHIELMKQYMREEISKFPDPNSSYEGGDHYRKSENI